MKTYDQAKSMDDIRNIYSRFGVLASGFHALEFAEEDDALLGRRLMDRAHKLIHAADQADGLTDSDRHHIQKEALTIHEVSRGYVPYATRPLRPELGSDQRCLTAHSPADLCRISYYRLEDDFRWWMHMEAEDIDKATSIMTQAENLFNEAETHRKDMTDLEYRWIRRGCFMIETLVECFDGSRSRAKLPAFDKNWKGRQ